jgi:hypothetical protein
MLSRRRPVLSRRRPREAERRPMLSRRRPVLSFRRPRENEQGPVLSFRRPREDERRKARDATRNTRDVARSAWDAARSTWDVARSAWDVVRNAWDARRSLANELGEWVAAALPPQDERHSPRSARREWRDARRPCACGRRSPADAADFGRNAVSLPRDVMAKGPFVAKTPVGYASETTCDVWPRRDASLRAAPARTFRERLTSRRSGPMSLLRPSEAMNKV